MSSFSKHADKSLVTFLTKTLSILDNPLYEEIISWDHSGKMIVIKNQQAFQNEILSKQFKHKNIKSFVRQLNMYGFKKVKKGIAKNSFYHPYFVKGLTDQMSLIRRRKNCKTMNQQNLPPLDYKIQPSPISNKNIKSEETIVSSALPHQNQMIRLIDNSFSKDMVIQEFNPTSYYDMNPWNCLNEEVFQYQDSYQYPSFLQDE